MDIQKCILYLTICLFGFLGCGIGQDLQCFVPGECTKSTLIASRPIRNEFECLDVCKGSVDCSWFVFYPHNNWCNLFSSCESIDATHCPDCITGAKPCVPPEPVCKTEGRCSGDVLHTEYDVASEKQCMTICQSFERCNWFSHQQSTSTCSLMADCEELDITCQDCSSGESRCQEPGEDTAWHLIFGGTRPYIRGLDVDIATVELFNWKTGEHCQLEDLPNVVSDHTGTVINGIPVYCSSHLSVDKLKCFKLNKATRTWEQIRDIAFKAENAVSVHIPFLGWHVFGGVGNSLSVSQRLRSLDGNWDFGPELFQHTIDYGQCLVQINSTLTGFFGGYRNGRQVVTFDWTKMEYTKHSSENFGFYFYSACALMKGSNGEKLVAILEKTMQLWNPDDGSVKTVNSPLTGDNHFGPSMLSVNNEKELILYEAYGSSKERGIWQYFLSNDTWTKIGEMVTPRMFSVALPVIGMACP